MKPALVSVLMACFNAEQYIAEALDSVLAQTYGPIEIIAVDDGSTDGTGAILERYRAKGVRVIEQRNRGQCSAANRALAEASGDLVKFFDADDVMAPDLIALQVERLGDRIDAIAMAEWARFYTDPSEARFDPLPMYRDAEPVDWLTSEWKSGEPMMQCAMWLIPAKILERTGGWNEQLTLINDFEFFTRVLLEAKYILYAPGARLYYRSGVSGSLSKSKTREAGESASRSLLLGAGHLLAFENSLSTRRACANILMTFEYTFYPNFPDLCRQTRVATAVLGGSDLEPSGPPGFHRLRRWVGWRIARKIQIWAELWSLNRASRLVEESF